MKRRLKRQDSEISDAKEDHYLMKIGQDERLYKFYFFRPTTEGNDYFEYRILSKEKPNGMLEMVSYNFKIVDGVPQKSSITKVPEISKDQLDEIVQNVVRKTNTGPDEFEELNLSEFSTIDEQLEFLQHEDRVDSMYIM